MPEPEVTSTAKPEVDTAAEPEETTAPDSVESESDFQAEAPEETPATEVPAADVEPEPDGTARDDAGAWLLPVGIAAVIAIAVIAALTVRAKKRK